MSADFTNAIDRLIEHDRQYRSTGKVRHDRSARLRALIEAQLDRTLAQLKDGRVYSQSNPAVAKGFRLASFLQGREVEQAVARSSARFLSNDESLGRLLRAEQDASLELEAAKKLLRAAYARGSGVDATVARLKDRNCHTRP